MVVGMGVDVVEVSQVKRLLQKYRQKFLNRIFTEQEQRYCFNKPRPHLHLAVRFAAKEAVAKSLGTGKRGFSWKEIEVINDSYGKPNILLTGQAAKIARQKKIAEVLISLSFAGDTALASALALQYLTPTKQTFSPISKK